MICGTNNFTVEANSLDLPQSFEATNVSDLLKEVLDIFDKMLEGGNAPFSLSKASSLDPDTYVESLDILLEYLEKILVSGTKNFKLSTSSAYKIAKVINEKLLPKIKIRRKKDPTAANISDGRDEDLIVPEDLLISETTRQNLQRSKVLNLFYGKHIAAGLFRQRAFNESIRISCIIDDNENDASKRKIINTKEDLNVRIEEYKAQQYKIIRDYLFNVELISIDEPIPQYLYAKHKVQKNYVNALNVMYNIIMQKQRDGILEEAISNGWERAIFNQSDSFFEALNAYINLVYFDDCLEEAVGGFISSDESLIEPITKTEEGTYLYKYKFGSENSLVKENMGDAPRDAIKEMGKFSKILIESIPMFLLEESGKELKLNNNVTAVSFTSAFTNLFNSLSKVTGDDYNLFKYLLLNYETLGESALREAFDKLFSTKSLRNLLKNGDINDYDLSVLYSVYRKLWKAKNSWSSIESKNVKQLGFTANYPIIDSILAVSSSSVAMNYLQSVYNRNEERQETTIKTKFPTFRSMFEIIESVNRDLVARGDKEQIINIYKLTRTPNTDTYRLLLPNIEVTINLNKNATNGILTKKESSDWFECPLINDVKDVDISTLSLRYDLLSDSPKSEELKKLIAALKFIDEMLGSSFSKDTDGLTEFYMFNLISKGNALKHLMASATTTLALINTYNDFSKQNKYATSQLVEYLKQNLPPLIGPNFAQMSNEVLNKLISNKYNGLQLIALSGAQGWLKLWTHAKAIISGDVSKAVTNDLEGNKIPNYSPTFTGGKILQLLYALKILESGAALHLLFASNLKAIILVVEDTDVLLEDGTKKSVKTMTESELLHHAIVDKFFIPIMQGHLYVQPTTYSDKTKYIEYDIDLKNLGLENATSKQIIQKYLETIGAAYHKVYNHVLRDYAVVFAKELLLIEEVYNGNVSLLSTKDIELNINNFNINQLYDALFTLQEIEGLSEWDDINENTYRIINLINNRIDYIESLIPTKVLEIETLLKQLTEQQLYDKAYPLGITIYRDTHFRNLGNLLTLNELLYEFGTDLYQNTASLEKRLNKEKIRFLEVLLQNDVVFDITRTKLDKLTGLREGLLDIKGNATTRALLKFFNNSSSVADSWVLGNRMILAKIKNNKTGSIRNVVYGISLNMSSDESLEVNPLLDKFFYLHSLIGNNLRFSLTGSEINHKVKTLGKEIAKLNKLLLHLSSDTLQALNGLSEFEIISKPDIINTITNPIQRTNSLKEIENIQKLLTKIDKKDLLTLLNIKNPTLIDVKNLINSGTLSNKTINYLKLIYDERIYRIEAAALGAQLKRNVIIPATMHLYALNKLYGITDSMKVAVIDDIQAYVFNPDGAVTKYDKGKGTSVDAHDGSAFINPITSILENWSLQDSEVGNVKKPIWHHYDALNMTASLVKFAADTMTNLWMRLSAGSSVSLYNLFKKMSNKRWSELNLLVDLINGCAYKSNTRINFGSDIANHLPDGNHVYYSLGNTHYEIYDFGKDLYGYYTKELQVSSTGVAIDELQKVYHGFDSEGHHKYRVKDGEIPIIDRNLQHDIDSTFELHSVFGGIFSESLNGDYLISSEASNYIVARYANLVANYVGPKELKAIASQTLDNYFLPIKHSMIDYIANNSAVKNGAGNVNISNRFYDNLELRYITLSTKYYGILMDADHTADEAKMTEFSLVISSLDAGGRMHDYVKQIYDVLGKVAIEEADIELDALDAFRTSEDIHKLYDIVGRTIINNLKNLTDKAGLASSILKNIEKEFNLHGNHIEDSIKIPFSDPNIYNSILSTMVSIINRKSVKREYPGTGAVMVPGYDIVLLWNINGESILYEDLVKIAYNWISLPNNEDILSEVKLLAMKLEELGDLLKYNSYIIQEYLKFELSKLPIMNTKDYQTLLPILLEFLPLDIVNLYFTDSTGKQQSIIFNLDKIEDYYAFKFDTNNFINKLITSKGLIYNTEIGLAFQKNITKARNLAPMRVNWEYEDAGGIHKMNLYDHQAIVNVYKGIRDANVILKALDELNSGYYTDENGVTHKLTKYSSTPAEMVMSNLYKSKFSIQEGHSLNDVIKLGLDYFNPKIEIIESALYDLVFTKANNQHTYITISKGSKDSDTLIKDWKYTIKEDWSYDSEKDENGNIIPYEGTKNIVSKIYAATKDNKRLFLIGREIVRDDIETIVINGKTKFIDSDTKQEAKGIFRIKDGRVILEVIFIQLKETTKEVDNGLLKYTTYSINYNKLLESMPKKKYSAEAIAKYQLKDKDGNLESELATIARMQLHECDVELSKILVNIYQSESFRGILVNRKTKRSTALKLKKILPRMGNALAYDSALRDLLLETGKLFDKATNIEANVKDNNEIKIEPIFALGKAYTRLLRPYYNSVANKAYTSFKKAQYLTASRIPALTLQSFMKMQCIGFTGNSKNLCFVSHWLTWLQGSDY